MNTLEQAQELQRQVYDAIEPCSASVGITRDKDNYFKILVVAYRDPLVFTKPINCTIPMEIIFPWQVELKVNREIGEMNDND